MKKRKISKRQLLLDLRKILIHPETRIIIRKLKDHHGESTWEDRDTTEGIKLAVNLRIYLDLRRDNHVSLVLHELLHVYMSVFLDIQAIFSQELEESAVSAWENTLYDYLLLPENEKLLESWSNAIKRKLV